MKIHFQMRSLYVFSKAESWTWMKLRQKGSSLVLSSKAWFLSSGDTHRYWNDYAAGHCRHPDVHQMMKKKKKNLENAFNLRFSGAHLASFLVVFYFSFFSLRNQDLVGFWLEMKVKDGVRRKTATGDNPPVSNCLTGSHGERSKESGRWSKKYRDEPEEEALRGELALSRQELVASWNLHHLQFYFSNPVF